MKTRALCHGKLRLGTRFRNIWNGRWWAHVRLCGSLPKAFMRSSETTPNNAGTPSSLAAIRGADCLPKVQNADANCGPLEQTELGQLPRGERAMKWLL